MKVAENLTFENERLLKSIKSRQSNLTKLSSYLSELESQLALIFAASPDIIVFLDKDCKIVKISDAAFTILGYTKDELTGKCLWDFISAEDIELTKNKFEEMQSRKILYFEENGAFINHWISKTGNKVKLVWRFSVCDEREQQTIGVATDVTYFGANNLYNFKLLQKTVDLSSDGIVITDALQKDNPVVYVNNSYEKITGYKQKELIGRNCRLMQSEETKNSRAITTLKNNLKQGKGCDILLQNIRKTGELFYNHLVISAVVESGVAVNYIGIVRDVTDEVGIRFDWSPNSETGFTRMREDHE